MRAMALVGLLLIVLGIFTFALPSVYQSDSTNTVGDVTLTQVNTFMIPAWAGGAIIAAGVVLLLVGAATRPRLY